MQVVDLDRRVHAQQQRHAALRAAGTGDDEQRVLLRRQRRGDFDIELADEIRPQQEATLVITDAAGASRRVPLVLRIDTPIEVDYYRHGGILPFVLRQLLAA